MAAMTSPVLTSILASRQTDIEHSGIGWTLAASAGHAPGALCRAKLAALAILLLPAIFAQTLFVLGMGLLAGIQVPLDVAPWAIYTVLLYLVNIAFCALHIWLAALVENQLISVGIGILGAFLAVFSLLLPTDIVKAIPWGYYAIISHVGIQNGEITPITPPYGWATGFLALISIAFFLATRQLDRVER